MLLLPTVIRQIKQQWRHAQTYNWMENKPMGVFQQPPRTDTHKYNANICGWNSTASNSQEIFLLFPAALYNALNSYWYAKKLN